MIRSASKGLSGALPQASSTDLRPLPIGPLVTAAGLCGHGSKHVPGQGLWTRRWIPAQAQTPLPAHRPAPGRNARQENTDRFVWPRRTSLLPLRLTITNESNPTLTLMIGDKGSRCSASRLHCSASRKFPCPTSTRPYQTRPMRVRRVQFQCPAQDWLAPVRSPWLSRIRPSVACASACSGASSSARCAAGRSLATA